MPSGLDRIRGVKLFESLDFSQHVRINGLLCPVEALVYLTVALRIAVVVGFGSYEVRDPILDADRSSEDNIDRLI